MLVSRNDKEKTDQALKKARTQVATYESFLADYRQNNRNHTSGRSLADSCYRASSNRCSSAPNPTSLSQQHWPMPIASCCPQPTANCTFLALSSPRSNPRGSSAPTSVSRRASISDRRHSHPPTYSRWPLSWNSTQEAGLSSSNCLSSTSPNSSMEACNGRRLSAR